MIKMKNHLGYVVYKISAEECFSFGGAAICDDCNTFCPQGGYLVPVLNYFMCAHCFWEWNESCKFYPEDLEFERNICYYYERILPVLPSSVVLRSADNSP